jgi:hypothetical protein
VLVRRRTVAAWRRWAAKAPHNRVKREPIRDTNGHVVGYTQPVPTSEPPLPEAASRKVTRPSGRIEVELLGPSVKDLRRMQDAYRAARCPCASPEEVRPLAVPMAEVVGWLKLCVVATA